MEPTAQKPSRPQADSFLRRMKQPVSFLECLPKPSKPAQLTRCSASTISMRRLKNASWESASLLLREFADETGIASEAELIAHGTDHSLPHQRTALCNFLRFGSGSA